MSEERIRLMTKLAFYEQEKEQQNMAVNQYFLRDYVTFQMVKAFVCSTVAFGIMVVMYVLYKMNELMDLLYKMDYQAFVGKILVLYVLYTIAFQIIALWVAIWRYKRAHREQRRYLSMMKKVARLQETEETGGQL